MDYISHYIGVTITKDAKTMGIKKGKKGINTAIELPTTIDFYNLVMTMTTKLEVSQACNELTGKFHARKLAESYIVKKRSAYRKEFLLRTDEDIKKFSTEKPDLFKELFIPAKKKPDIIQHCAIDMLDRTEEEQAIVDKEREISKQASMGIKNGVVMDISNVTKIDITKIIKESLKCLTDDDSLTIACGLLNLTGLRPGELCMPRHEHKEAGIVEHTMVAVSEYEIAFRGVTKKRDADGTLSWYKRITLVPAQKIVDAREKYLQSKKVQALPTDTEKFSQSGFYQALNDKYTELFGDSLSTLKVINENGTLNGKDGKPHKGRSFYACALRSIIKANQNVITTDKSVALIVQNCIAHNGEVTTEKYLGKYDDSLLINPPTYIEVSSNIEEYGEMSVNPVIPVKENMKSFDFLNFVDGIDKMFGDSWRISHFTSTGMSETQAVLAYIKLRANTTTTVKSVESTVDNHEITQTEKMPEKLKDKVKEKSVTEKVNEIIEGIMKYNHQCAKDDFKKVVIPSHGYINTISKMMINGKTVAYITAKKCLDDVRERLDKELKALGIVEGVLDDKHNGKYHKKTQDELSAKILEYI